MDDITSRLINSFSLVFPDIPQSQVVNLSADNTAAWDSVAFITLANVIEEEFGFAMDLEDITELDTFAKVRDYVQRQVAVS
jgi:acyl carrier protein